MARLYSPISEHEFRLLQINHNTNKVLQCSLCTFRRQECPEYVAISYTWGPAEHPAFQSPGLPTSQSSPTRSIRVHGHTLPVTNNLFDLLAEICQSCDIEAWYWIDAVCINQFVKKEKTTQVRQMGDVYSNASLVLIWLGKGNNSTDKTITILRQLGSIFDRRERDPDPFKALMNISNHNDSRLPRLLGLVDITEIDWFEMIAFFRRSWFFRVWTIQECALATTAICLCGEHRISWQTLVRASQLLALMPFGESVMYHARLHFGQQSRLPPQLTEFVRGLLAGHSLEDLVQSAAVSAFRTDRARSSATVLLMMMVTLMSPFGATEPQDRVFAALAIMRKLENSYGQLGMAIDYESSTADVFTRLMTMYVNETKSLGLLCEVRHFSRSKITDLPSWVIDFSVERPAPFSSQDYGRLESRDQLGDMQTPRVQYNANKGTSGLLGGPSVSHYQLDLCGFTFGTVTHIGESWNELGSHLPFERTCRMLLACPRTQLTETSRVDVLWKVMTCDLKSFIAANVSDTDLRTAFSHYLMVASLVAVNGELERGGTVESCLHRLKFQDALARLDDTGSVPSPHAVRERCNRFGLDRPNLSADGRMLAVGMAMKDLKIGSFNSVVSTNMVDRRTFLLDTGDLGLGVQSVQPGDLLCIVADGARTPLLMRQAGTQTNARHLIGEAYVRGIMFGEAVDQMEDRRLRWERICLV